VPVNAEEKAAAEAEQLRLLRDAEIDLVVLARYMQILPPGIRGAVPGAHHQRAPFVSAGLHGRQNRTTRRLREA